VIKITTYVKRYPGLSLAEITVDPVGLYVYSRAALLAAIAALVHALENDKLQLKKFELEMSIEIPCPPLFNAYYRPLGSVFIEKDRSLPESEQVDQIVDKILRLLKMKGTPFTALGTPTVGRNSNLWQPFEKHGELTYGTIRVSDALADTYLYLGQTRKYLFETLFVSSKGAASEKVPPEVIIEINSLFHFWDQWRPKHRLDLSKSDIPNFDASIEPIKLANLVIKNHPSLAALLFMVLAHEYGHSQRALDPEAGKEVGRDLLKHFIEDVSPDCVPGVAPLFDFCQDLLRSNQEVFASWQAEIASDILGLQWYMMLLPQAKEDIFKALVVQTLIFSIIEVYNARRYSVADFAHPAPVIRFFLNTWFCSNALGWKYPRDFFVMAEAIGTIIAIRSQCR
jgi:hypothetical protein